MDDVIMFLVFGMIFLFILSLVMLSSDDVFNPFEGLSEIFDSFKDVVSGVGKVLNTDIKLPKRKQPKGEVMYTLKNGHQFSLRLYKELRDIDTGFFKKWSILRKLKKVNKLPSLSDVERLATRDKNITDHYDLMYKQIYGTPMFTDATSHRDEFTIRMYTSIRYNYTPTKQRYIYHEAVKTWLLRNLPPLTEFEIENNYGKMKAFEVNILSIIDDVFGKDQDEIHW